MRTLVAGIALLSLTGCAVGPNYRRPVVSTPQQWPEARGTSATAATELNEWWRSFQDPQLDALIHQAVSANYDLAQATTRVQEARASLGLAQSSYSPQINMGSSAARARQVDVGLVPRATGISQVPFAIEGGAFNLN